jgi:hypothetical protein
LNAIVRIKTEYYFSSGAAVLKKTIRTLKRKSDYDIVSEECLYAGEEIFFKSIVNLDECKDGVYKVIFTNIYRDWESGIIEDYDLKLIPYEGETNEG